MPTGKPVTESGSDFLDGLGQGGNLDAELVNSEAVQDAFAAGLRGKLLIDIQAAPHFVLNLRARAQDFRSDRPDGLGKCARVSILPNPSDRPPPGARGLTRLADDLVEDQAITDRSTYAVDGNVNRFGKQLAQLTFPVRVALKEDDRIEGDTPFGRQDDVAAATAQEEGEECECHAGKA